MLCGPPNDPENASIMAWYRKTRLAVSGWLERHGGFGLYAVVLLVAMAAAYDAQVWRLGTYYDDWEGIFLYKQGFSPQQIWDYFLRDRPFSFLVHIVYNPIIGASPVGWHLLALLLNWVAILLLVRALLRLWPGRVMEVGWIGLLLALYPGMHRQFVPHTSMPHYTSMLLFTLSLLLMVKAFQDKSHRVLFLVISVALGMLQVLIIEYFAALELLRILILFHIFRATASSWKEAAGRALRAWWPYAMVFAAFLVYHFGLLPAIQPKGLVPQHPVTLFGQLAHHPLSTLRQYTENILQDTLYSALYAWTLPWVPQDIDLQARAVLFSWILGAVIAALCALVMWSWQRKASAGPGSTSAAFLVILCVSGLLLGGLPAWIIGDQAVKGMWADRFLFGQILGAVPLAVVAVAWLTGPDRRNALNLVFAVVLMGSVSLQFRVGNDYAVLWDRTRSYYWQLKWRVPSLQPGTFIVSSTTPVGGTDIYQVGLAVNTAFNAGYGKEQVQYWWFNGPENLWEKSIGKYRPAMNIDYTFRSLIFRSNMRQALPVVQAKWGGRCLQVLDPVYQGEPGLDQNDQNLFSISHVSMILPKEKPLPQDVFGAELPHDWCYYYERADLARQFGQWDQVLLLWQQAGPLISTFSYGPEYLPFIEAFARTGQWARAVDLTMKADAKTTNMPEFLCRTWTRIVKATPASDTGTGAWTKVQAALSCTQPQPEVP